MRTRPGLPVLPCLACALFWSGHAAWAQVTPQGIDVDADGVLRSRTTDPDPRLAELWKNAKNVKKDGKYLYVSLPRLFAEARKLIESRQPLPDEIRYVGGITKLEYLFVYPEEKDLILAGPSEPVDSRDPFRPLGKITGRPVLQLEDLVTALRAFRDNQKPERVGCDIEPTKEIQDRISKTIRELGPTIEKKGLREAAKHVAEVGGPMPVIYYGVAGDSRLAFVCIEADYRLKELTLGLMPSPVSKVKSFLSMLKDRDKPHRFSLESDYEALLMSGAGNAFQLKGLSLKVNGGLLGVPDTKSEEMAEGAPRFIEMCNRNLPELMRHIVCIADLANLSDLLVLAALLFEDKLAEKAGWELSWVLDPKSWPTAKLKVPKTVQTLCNYAKPGKLVFVAGGVLMNPIACSRNRVRDDKVAEKALRPEEGSWKRSP